MKRLETLSNVFDSEEEEIAGAVSRPVSTQLFFSRTVYAQSNSLKIKATDSVSKENSALEKIKKNESVVFSHLKAERVNKSKQNLFYSTGDSQKKDSSTKSKGVSVINNAEERNEIGKTEWKNVTGKDNEEKDLTRKENEEITPVTKSDNTENTVDFFDVAYSRKQDFILHNELKMRSDTNDTNSTNVDGCSAVDGNRNCCLLKQSECCTSTNNKDSVKDNKKEEEADDVSNFQRSRLVSTASVSSELSDFKELSLGSYKQDSLEIRTKEKSGPSTKNSTEKCEGTTIWNVCLQIRGCFESITKAEVITIISVISGFKLNETVIDIFPIDPSIEMMVVIVKCPTQKLHDEFLETVKVAGIPACSKYEKNFEKDDQTRIKTFSRTETLPKFKVCITLKDIDLNDVKIDDVAEFISSFSDFNLNTEDFETDKMNGGSREYNFRLSFHREELAKNFVEAVNKISFETGMSANLLTEEDFAILELWEEIFDKARIQTEQHHEKLAAVSDELQTIEIETTGKSKGWMSFPEFDRKQAKVKPLKLKHEELLGQETEFKAYVDELQEKIFRLKNSKTFKENATRLRSEFELECLRFSSALPMYAKRKEIIETVNNNRVGIIVGETGSGKSTQILQYLYYAGFTETGIIVCTQPRKVAAVSLATRVAQEMGCKVGQLVGYKVGMQAKQSPATKLLFVTDHILLNSCLKDPLFSQYSCLVIDEAHERSIYTDLLLGFIKRSLKRRDDLKVLITSATIDPKVFIQYFDKATRLPVVNVPGRVFPVDVIYERHVDKNYVEAAINKAVWIHEKLDPGDVLVFLTNPLETEKACKALRLRCGERRVLALELNGRLQLEDQKKVFEVTPAGKRKIVFATNSAETSVTIPGIKYVIDTGQIREMNYEAKKNMSVLSLTWTSKSSADQRKGRAGRTDCGQCYRLYTEDDYKGMRNSSVPEILRIHLGQALLKLLMLGIVDPLTFDFVESPKQEAIEKALLVLEELGAYEVEVGITEIGKKLAQISVEPRLGKLVLRGIEEGIGYDAMILSAVCSAGGSAFFRGGSLEDKQNADRTKTRFCDEWGDMITGAMIYKEWVANRTMGDRGLWCKRNNINGKTMKVAQDQLKEVMQTFKQDLKIIVTEKPSEDPKLNEKLAMILLDCYPSNLARYLGHEKVGYCLASNPKLTLQLHPSSSLLYMGELSKWVVYQQIVTTSDVFMSNVTYVDESWIMERLSTGKLKINLEEVEKEMPALHTIDGLGKQLISVLLEQRAQNLQKLEDGIKKDFAAETPPRFSVQLDAYKRRLAVYVDKKFENPAVLRVRSFLENLKQPLIEATIEERIRPGSNVKFILGSGLKIKSVLMPGEQRQVAVMYKTRDICCDLQEVRDVLSAYGEIENLKSVSFSSPKNSSTAYGCVFCHVTFKNAQSALSAVKVGSSLSDKFKVDFSMKDTSNSKSKSGGYSVKVEVCRRPLVGTGYIQFRSSSVANAVISKSDSFWVKKQTAYRDTLRENISISQDKRNCDQAFIRNIPRWATQEIVKQGLIDATGERYRGGIVNVILQRMKQPEPFLSQQIYRLLQEKITRELSKSGEFSRHDYEFQINEPKDKDFAMFVYLKFSDHDKALAAADLLDGVVFGEQEIEAKVDLKANFIVSEKVYGMCKTDVEKEVKSLNNSSTGPISVQMTRRGNGSYLIQIETSEFVDLREARTRLDDLIYGHRMDMISGKFLQLKSDDGQRKIKDIQTRAGVRIRPDDRQEAVFIYGRREPVMKAKRFIEEYLSKTETNVRKELSIRDGGYPRGVMKALVCKYGSNLEGLKSLSGASSLDLNLRRHSIRFNGSKDSYKILKTLIEETAEILPGSRPTPEPTPECFICLSNIDYDDCYVTEYCGHFCCTDCGRDLIRNGLTNKVIPIRCAMEGCGENLVLRDFQNLLPKIEDTFDPAIRSFISICDKEYAYCFTPDCPMIYRRSKKEALEFVCSECHISICTKCDASYHPGMTCEVFKNFFVKAEDDVKIWLSEDTERRALCTKCGVGIEKNGGCNHMECTACKAHICWKCKKYFDSKNACYQHLTQKHGGYYEDETLNAILHQFH